MILKADDWDTGGEISESCIHLQTIHVDFLCLPLPCSLGSVQFPGCKYRVYRCERVSGFSAIEGDGMLCAQKKKRRRFPRRERKKVVG
jgi:hypothetical protein